MCTRCPSVLESCAGECLVSRHSSALSRDIVPTSREGGGRCSAAAALIRSGASPKAVQTIFGHRSAAFTMTVYGHIFDADLDDIAARLQDVISKAQAGPMRDGSFVATI